MRFSLKFFVIFPNLFAPKTTYIYIYTTWIFPTHGFPAFQHVLTSPRSRRGPWRHSTCCWPRRWQRSRRCSCRSCRSSRRTGETRLGKRTWLVGGLEHEFYFPIYWVANHPNWLIFFRGVAQPPTSMELWSPLVDPLWNGRTRVIKGDELWDFVGLFILWHGDIFFVWGFCGWDWSYVILWNLKWWEWWINDIFSRLW